MKISVGDKVNGKVIKKILFTIPVLHKGWDMDTEAKAVLFKNGKRGVVTTSHGNWLVELTQQELLAKLQEYTNAKQGMNAASQFLAELSPIERYERGGNNPF